MSISRTLIEVRWPDVYFCHFVSAHITVTVCGKPHLIALALALFSYPSSLFCHNKGKFADIKKFMKEQKNVTTKFLKKGNGCLLYLKDVPKIKEKGWGWRNRQRERRRKKAHTRMKVFRKYRMLSETHCFSELHLCEVLTITSFKFFRTFKMNLDLFSKRLAELMCRFLYGFFHLNSSRCCFTSLSICSVVIAVLLVLSNSLLSRSCSVTSVSYRVLCSSNSFTSWRFTSSRCFIAESENSKYSVQRYLLRCFPLIANILGCKKGAFKVVSWRVCPLNMKHSSHGWCIKKCVNWPPT